VIVLLRKERKLDFGRDGAQVRQHREWHQSRSAIFPTVSQWGHVNDHSLQP
jgi:hypothetical protein